MLKNRKTYGHGKEYVVCTPDWGVSLTPPHKKSVLDMILNCILCEITVLKVWKVRSAPLFQLISGPLCIGVVVHFRVSFVCLKDLLQRYLYPIVPSAKRKKISSESLNINVQWTRFPNILHKIPLNRLICQYFLHFLVMWSFGSGVLVKITQIIKNTHTHIYIYIYIY